MPCALFAQSYAIANYTDPLAPGYVYRASRMLSTGNPLGAMDQSSASVADFESLSPSLQVDWLADEGCAMFERGDAGCVEVLTRLANDFPAYPKATQALLTLGDWYWYHKDWHEAIAQYSKVDIKRLGSGQRPLYSYRKALAYLRCGLPDSAVPLIASIASVPGYERAAKFYTAYIHYLDKDYDSAYQMMEEVASGEVKPLSVAKEDDSQAKNQGASGRVRRGRSGGAAGPNLVPAQRQYVSDGIEPLYYMAQIEYLRGQYDDVIGHAATIMAKNPVDDLLPELHRISGLSHFKKGEYDAARPHLELFVGSVEYPNDDALYALGAIQYADGDMTDAEKNLRQLTDRNNDLAQG